MGKTIVQGGLIVGDDKEFVGDVIIEDGKICGLVDYAQNGGMKPTYDAASSTIVNAEGMVVMPGGIDPHVHLNYPQGGNHIYSADDFYTGSVSALCGGTTSFIDFAEAKPTESLPHALEDRIKEAETSSLLDFSLHMTVSRADKKTLEEELPACIQRGCTSFKLYTAYDGIRIADDGQMLLVFKAIAKNGAVPIVHSENHYLIMDRLSGFKAANAVSAANHPMTRPVEGESEATHRVAMLSRAAGCTVHIAHVTAAIALPTFKLPGSKQQMTGEVCAHHLSLTDDVYHANPLTAPDFCCAPPMRPQSDVDAMWEALKDGTLQFVISDHCPFTTSQRRGVRRIPEFRRHWGPDRVAGSEALAEHVEKVAGAGPEAERWWPASEPVPPFWTMPGGVSGIEPRVMIAWHYGVNVHHMTPTQLSHIISTAAAKRYGLYPKKGSLSLGADADVLVLNPKGKFTFTAKSLHQNIDFCHYDGMTVGCSINSVFVAGKLMVHNGALVCTDHHGKFIQRKPFNSNF